MRKIHKPAKRGSITPRVIRASVKKVIDARNIDKERRDRVLNMGDVIQLKDCANAATALRNIADQIEAGELENQATVICGVDIFHVGEFDNERAAESAIFNMSLGIQKLTAAAISGLEK